MATILIVDDDLFIREFTAMTIQAWGHETYLASDVGEALVVLSSPQRLDVLFTDICLKATPLGGCDLAHRAVALRPELHVLYTTGNRITREMEASFVEGALYLRKPYTPQQLHDSIGILIAA
jgi:DNA-binding NtrC family response regulator